MPRSINHAAKLIAATDTLMSEGDKLFEQIDSATYDGYDMDKFEAIRRQLTSKELAAVQRQAAKVQKKLDALSLALAAAVVATPAPVKRSRKSAN